ncbi:trimethylguanosine synthase [Fistulifera solaris]|uniref:Trimethylguanosine synthase n=1 Tax=Fistulifera solaris TaxID=1519565 RepID=A0A1Z5JJX0_FISSO|nr:trimethylguanosine synthase [Fistulifera solaris]|eukprot:GAX14088.1 trimethylguanosine synthase [Fistulifera solaris]
MSTPPRGNDVKGRHNNTHHHNHHHTPPPPRTPPFHPHQPHAMSVLVTRVDLYDSGFVPTHEITTTLDLHPIPLLTPYSFDPSSSSSIPSGSIAIARIPPTPTTPAPFWRQLQVMDTTKPSPLPAITKYWNQRHRLFHKFDQGIQLDEEGWFSVTPEQIAQHVAQFTLQQYAPRVLLDAFCGCGGNAIQFASVVAEQVVAVDVDRQKLRKAAHNARLYGIPAHRLVFIECNVLFLLEYCYKNGEFILDQPIACPQQAQALMEAMPPPVATEVYEGYQIGGIDLLPRTIDTIFMDPPWGGVDYEVLFGKHGYDLEHQMKIERPRRANVTTVQDDFFDSFIATNQRKQERRAQFNHAVDDSNCVNGVELLRLAASVTPHVLYDVPRNTKRQSVGHAAILAGYRGICLWEEHYLNARLKTVTVYLGKDWSSLVPTTKKNNTE